MVRRAPFAGWRVAGSVAAMLTFLSDEWIEALDEAAAADDQLAELTAGLALTIEQEVTGGPLGDVRYHVTFDDGKVTVRAGAAASPTVRFSQDHQTAAAIANGTGSAQRAFMTGQLQVGGDLRVLLAHGDVLSQLDDAFGSVRAQTAPIEPATAADPTDA